MKSIRLFENSQNHYEALVLFLIYSAVAILGLWGLLVIQSNPLSPSLVVFLILTFPVGLIVGGGVSLWLSRLHGNSAYQTVMKLHVFYVFWVSFSYSLFPQFAYLNRFILVSVLCILLLLIPLFIQQVNKGWLRFLFPFFVGFILILTFLQPVRLVSSIADTRIIITVEPGLLLQDAAPTVSWETDNIREIIVNDSPTVGVGRLENAPLDTSFSIRYEDANGTLQTVRYNMPETGVVHWANLVVWFMVTVVTGFLMAFAHRLTNATALLPLATLPAAFHLIQADVGGILIVLLGMVLGFLGWIIPQYFDNLPRWGSLTIHAGVIVTIIFLGFDVDWVYDRWHLDTWLGPIHSVMQGDTIFVNTTSQYGVMMPYVMALPYSLFQIPLSYASFSGFMALLTLFHLFLLYYFLTQSIQNRLISTLAIVIIIGFMVVRSIGLPQIYPATGLLRFGGQHVVILLSFLYYKYPARRNLIDTLQFTWVGWLAIWSFETFIFTLMTYLAMRIFDVFVLRLGWFRGLRFVMVRLGLVFVSVCLMMLGFYLFTWFRSGQFPEWDHYFGLLFFYSGMNVPWTQIAGLSDNIVLIGYSVLYIFLAVTLFRLLKVSASLQAYVIPMGFAVMSVTQHYYWVRFTFEYLYASLSYPLVILAAFLWDQSFRVQAQPMLRRSVQWLAMSTAMIVLAGMLAVPRADNAVVTTPLERIYQMSVSAQPVRLATDWISERPQNTLYSWQSPLPDERLPYAVDLVNRHMADKDRIILIIAPELVVDLLIRTGKTHYYPTSFPAVESLSPIALDVVLSQSPPLQIGDLLLVDLNLWRSAGVSEFTPLEAKIFTTIQQEFDVEWVEVSPVDFAVIRLVEKP